MKAVVESIKVTYDVIVAKDKQLTDELNKTHLLAKQLKEEEAKQKEQRRVLDEREKKVAGIENALVVLSEAKKLKADNDASRTSLDAQARDFAEYRDKEVAKIQKDKETNEKTAKELAEKEAKLNDLVLEKVKKALAKA